MFDLASIVSQLKVENIPVHNGRLVIFKNYYSVFLGIWDTLGYPKTQSNMISNLKSHKISTYSIDTKIFGAKPYQFSIRIMGYSCVEIIQKLQKWVANKSFR